MLILTDGILVKKQSESRISKNKASKEVFYKSENESKNKAVFVSINMVLVEKKPAVLST